MQYIFQFYFVCCLQQYDSQSKEEKMNLKKNSRYGEMRLIEITMHGSHGFHANINSDYR